MEKKFPLSTKLYVKCIIYGIFTFSIFLFISCSSAYDEETIYTSIIVTNYLGKAKSFLLFVIFLLDSEKKYWLNLYSRLYYFHFTLARIKSFLQQNRVLDNNHKEIWSLSKVKPKKIFGNEFKKIRSECDYEIIENEKTFVKKTNEIIVNKHKEALIDQIEDIKKFCKRKIDIENYNKIEDYLSEIYKTYESFIESLKTYKDN